MRDQQKRSEKIDFENTFPFRHVEIDYRRTPGRNAGVIDSEIEPAVAAIDRPKQLGYRFLIGNVTFDKVAHVAKQSLCCRTVYFVSPRDIAGSASSDQFFADFKTDATCSTHHKRNLPVKAHAGFSL
jgi:hypothetical protein